MPFYQLKELPAQVIAPSYSTAVGVTITGQDLEIARATVPVGVGGEPHSHANEQICIVLQGHGRVRIGAEEREVGPGDAWLVPSGVEHEVVVDDELTLISCKNRVPA